MDNLEVDLPAMMKSKEDAVDGLTQGIEGLFKKNKVSIGSLVSLTSSVLSTSLCE